MNAICWFLLGYNSWLVWKVIKINPMKTLLSSQNQKSPVNSQDTVEDFESKLRKMTQCYQADQQVKYLHLQAEIDALIQQLQALKHQKQD